MLLYTIKVNSFFEQQNHCDKKYYTLSDSEIKGNDGFYRDNINEYPNKVKYKEKGKFADKVSVWCAFPVGGSQVHAHDDITYWLDLTNFVYAKETQDWLNTHKVPFVLEIHNISNFLQVGSIEEF
ncbi:hypothetical protein ABEB36_008212 [Hypothenemus hampei]|uniref:Cysteine dioxygenase n=1 Tax=Hypothenemus hampei TaxID=57062 RepID=A0ABD1EL46_HYPHA